MNLALRSLHLTSPFTLVLQHCQRLLETFIYKVGPIFSKQEFFNQPILLDSFVREISNSACTIKLLGSELIS